MQFTAKEDIEVPIEQAFEMLVDFEQFERAALRRGAEITRLDDLARPGVGAHWQADFTFRGRQRNLDLKIDEFERPQEIGLNVAIAGLEAKSRIELVALSRTRTRLSVWTDLTPRSLPARLLVQSLKLARNTLSQRLARRVSKLGRDFENRYARRRHA